MQKKKEKLEITPEENQQRIKKEQEKLARRNGLLIRYVICASACLILSFIYCAATGIFSPWQQVVNQTGWNINSELTKVMFILSNATFIVGMVCAGFGLLVVASNGGAFEMFVYGMRRFISIFQKDVNKIRFKTFYDYHIYKSSEPKKSFWYFIIIGVFFIALSGIFLAVYMKSR